MNVMKGSQLILEENAIERTNCVVCKAEILLDFLTLPNMPAFMGVTSESQNDDVFFDQN